MLLGLRLCQQSHRPSSQLGSGVDLQELSAGVYAGILGSRRTVEKKRFELEGSLHQEVVSKSFRIDVLRMGLPRCCWCSAA